MCILQKIWKRITIYALVILVLSLEGKSQVINPDQKFIDSNQVVIKGIFFVPQGCEDPTIEDINMLRRHIKWSRLNYKAMLHSRDTFEISRGPIESYHSKHSFSYFKEKADFGSWYLRELLEHSGYDRKTCPYVYVIVVMAPTKGELRGGGRNFNGGLNQGGGFVIMSIETLREAPNFQSTLRHDLGHAFGLTHVKNYGYDMETSESIMSYNKKLHTIFFKEGARPGILAPEDIFALSKNKKVFQKLTLKSGDIPPDYKIKEVVLQKSLRLPK